MRKAMVLGVSKMLPIELFPGFKDIDKFMEELLKKNPKGEMKWNAGHEWTQDETAEQLNYLEHALEKVAIDFCRSLADFRKVFSDRNIGVFRKQKYID